MKIPVSVAIITKNEERNIEEALLSVKDFEEIVIVDAFSEDKTIEICKKYTDKIYTIQWRGFANQKQFAVDKATLKWVLILDADERVTEKLKKEIVEKISNDDFDGYLIPRKNFFLGRWIKHSGWWPDYTLRLFKKDKGKLETREVHEKVIVNGRVGYLKQPILHYTYRSIEDFLRKIEIYSSYGALEIIKAKPSKFKVIFKIFLTPVFTFIKMFIIKLGIMDGLRGFILAFFYSFYSFLKYVKVWERQWK